ncbi:ion transporter [Paractinoplanes toevensis]|uniref:Ion transport domain-containing protein n=1 Tax=Paractinoplanes toevensis TaxID=571911 RepID=A0A919T7C8_9ACTN|nr:ion transporter [Actinoplanes toevensis]GIM89084.1 hypothetical protein Ato02nite_008770 [Actinoplanes toevensis]
MVLCLETYRDLAEAIPPLHWLEWLFRAIFVIEIVIRILAYGRRPQDFFKHGWNGRGSADSWRSRWSRSMCTGWPAG